MSGTDLKQEALALTQRVHALRDALNRRILGQPELIEDLVTALLAGGHVLLEGLPGLGKTLLVRSLGSGMGLSHSRIQFTPDLMPADVTGTLMVDEQDGKRTFRFQRGPIFAGLVLADEINRATPKTQSALLEAMQEASVTVAGESHRLPEPFHVIATQNPIELEGTFPLPEAQLDRFLFHLQITTPPVDAMVQILAGTTGGNSEPITTQLEVTELLRLQQLVRGVLCGSHLLRHVALLLRTTHPDAEEASDSTRRFVRYGASARAGQAIVLGAKARALLDGRAAVTRDDLDRCALMALRHRVVLGYEADAQGVQTKDLIVEWQQHADRLAR
jgi:MoxR-like ATPase